MEGQRPYDGFRADHPGGQKPPGAPSPAKRYPMQSFGRAPFARGPEAPPLPRRAPADSRYMRYEYATLRPQCAGNPKNMATWHIRNSPYGRGHWVPL